MKNYFILLSVLFNILFLNNILAQELTPDFSASSQEILVGQCVNFTNQSTGAPMFWQWTFQGAETPSSNLKNPKNICYYTPGTYDVILEIQNENQVKTKHLAGYITVLPNTLNLVANFETDITIVNLDSPVQFTDLSLNGPIAEYKWTFSGGNPSTSNLATPPPVVYSQVGSYSVKLSVVGENGQIDTKQKNNYIKVVNPPSEEPKANFIADRTFIQPGEFINFKDLSSGNPNSWEWEFEGAANNVSELQNPTGILFLNEGEYKVRLKIKNFVGEDEIIKEKHIRVFAEDPCVTSPIADFTSSNRIIKPGTKVYFEDKSQNLPTSWKWSFEGGSPNNYGISSITNGIEYNTNGYFNVSLEVSNACGSHTINKERYIIVLPNSTDTFCDTITNVDKNENVYSPNVNPWGKIGGHNSQRIRVYAEKYDKFSPSYINGIMFPVVKAKYAKPNSFVTFMIWSGAGEFPDDENIIAKEKVLIKDLNENFINTLEFDPPIEVSGSFFVGYKINYVDTNNDGKSDDDFAISIAKARTGENAENTFYVKSGGTWMTCTEKFGIKTASGIKLSGCIFDENSIEEFSKLENIKVLIYPNPASSEINLLIEGNDNLETRIRLLDIRGRILYSEFLASGNNLFSISTEHLNSGIYFVDITTNKERLTKKVIIAK